MFDQVKLFEEIAGPYIFNESYPALHLACYHGSMNIAKYLINSGKICLNTNFNGKGTALYFGASMGNINIVKLLLENGANPNVGVSGELFPISAAVLMNDEGMVDLLIKNNADVHSIRLENSNTLLHKAIRNGCNGIIKLLLNANRNNDDISLLRVQNSDGYIPLDIYFQSYNRTLNMVFFLPWNRFGNTSLYYAVYKGSVEGVNLSFSEYTNSNQESDGSKRCDIVVENPDIIEKGLRSLSLFEEF